MFIRQKSHYGVQLTRCRVCWSEFTKPQRVMLRRALNLPKANKERNWKALIISECQPMMAVRMGTHGKLKITARIWRPKRRNNASCKTVQRFDSSVSFPASGAWPGGRESPLGHDGALKRHLPAFTVTFCVTRDVSLH